MMKSFRIGLTAFLITAGMIKAAPVLAAPQIESVSLVRTSDLDLTTEKGRATLQHRLANAAADVCGTASSADLVGSNKIRECRVDVLAKARLDSVRLATRSGAIAVVAGR
jgi:UrcA family protein